MTALIITHSQDNESIPLVIQAIEAQGKKAFRFDTDRFPTEMQLDIYYGRTKRVILSVDDQILDLNEVSAVWYRRIAIGSKIPNSMDKQLREASLKESRVSIEGMIASISGFHLDPLPNIRRAENKQLQLQIARDIGLDTPRTLTTNNPIAVKQFAQECQQGMITKMLSSFAIYDEQGREKVVFTNPISSEDLDNLDGLRFCPMTFQEKIPKALELRTIVVGKRVLTAAVDSQALDKARYDWRKQGIALLDAWESYTLPEDVEEKLLKLMAEFGLNYGALDIILTPDGRHVFLEVNPVGEFFWLERCPGLPISQAIAEVLTNSPN
ncbi:MULTISPECIES: MvdD family ATP-grasp ribosomal peptide maturase [unclassified Nostoc]|uniref:MvdD family ATP-grasp ribosomal peptide maturase n=1 Tax=unclassified Nostoc TaxID=2593658 RepID=UPI0025AA92DF|nr:MULTISPECIES: MvdD family ATP-grasp ribosomal peptide maturase [unclassified Nostoc]MDM9586329.1 MvdD family ATP-grasp ribosomal peptide maturase [Nostoc sp. GT001]MDZ7943814.1 MvdD family ATP-grasp ribosomal peptide maturase [Nostoc sp. EfeVER01]MDZ7990754.1 MvdD family ATP-grasp ribosomal peptide maturase [Nostoc sp. EspVER01]